MQYLPHTKIVATLGPASSSREAMTAMIRAGANVFRLNFSHGTREEHRKTIEQIKSLNDELSSHVAILADLQGPKLRVGEIENNHIDLCEGDTLRFVTEKCLGTKDHICISYAEFPKDVSAGELILVDDGKIKLEVTATDGKSEVMAKVLNGGPLSSHKGVNLPNTNISLPCLTDEDLVNAQFALDNDVDWLALSFVRSASDVLTLKRIDNKNKNKNKKKKVYKTQKDLAKAYNLDPKEVSRRLRKGWSVAKIITTPMHTSNILKFVLNEDKTFYSVWKQLPNGLWETITSDFKYIENETAYYRRKRFDREYK